MKLSSRRGLLIGSLIGLLSSAAAGYHLIPIFEKSKENGAHIIEVTASLERANQEKQALNEQLESTSKELEASQTRIMELEPLQGQLDEANKKIETLKGEIEHSTTRTGELEQQIEEERSTISTLKKELSALQNTLAEKESELSQRGDWIGELQSRDDEIIQNAMYLVENFMKISSDENGNPRTDQARNRLLAETLTLVNKLESQRNMRRLFVDEVEKKIQQE